MPASHQVQGVAAPGGIRVFGQLEQRQHGDVKGALCGVVQGLRLPQQGKQFRGGMVKAALLIEDAQG